MADSSSPALLGRVVDVQPEERRAMWLSFAFFFFVLSSWYILRPIRDAMGIAGGVRNLPWLFMGTLTVTLLANPLYAAIVARFPVKRFIPYVYRFFIVNLLVFFALSRALTEEQNVWLGRVFFVWTSTFNLFVVSVFWSFMTDVFRTEQGKRLYGFIGAGGTLGGLAGAWLTASYAKTVGPVNLLLVSAVLLECATQCVIWFPAGFRDPAAAAPPIGLNGASPNRRETIAPRAAATTGASDAFEHDRPIGGTILAGIKHVSRSPYLLGIVLYTLLFTIGSTFLYFQQGDIVGRSYPDAGARTAILAKIDLAVNALTVLIQIFFTGRILKYLGVATTLALLPAITVIGSLALGVVPTIAVLAAVQILRRAGNYAVAGPTSEVLFTVVPREDKYKAKGFIDTFVYRVGDQIGAWTSAGLTALGLGVAGVSFVAAPIALVWLANSLWLGRRQQALALAQRQDIPSSTGGTLPPLRRAAATR